jgi:flagellar biosynthesis component FlhA
VSIRDLGAIVESAGDKARVTRDPGLLAEYARQAPGRAITAPHLCSYNEVAPGINVKTIGVIAA